MPIPLLWIGAGLAGAAIAKSAFRDAVNQQNDRRRFHVTEDLQLDDNHVAIHPSDWAHSDQLVTPVAGSLVSCGIFHSLDHTGIWTSDNLIIELNGNGLVRAISPERFLNDRSGKKIFVACNSKAQPLVVEGAEQRAKEQVYNYKEYDVLDNNCHRFSWQCISGVDQPVTLFSDLNHKLAKLFNSRIYWDVCEY